MTTKEIEKIIKNNKDYIDDVVNIIELAHSLLCILEKTEDPGYIHPIYTKLTNIIDNRIHDLLYVLFGVDTYNEDAFTLFWFDWNSKEQLSTGVIRADIIDGVKTFLELM